MLGTVLGAENTAVSKISVASLELKMVKCIFVYMNE